MRQLKSLNNFWKSILIMKKHLSFLTDYQNPDSIITAKTITCLPVITESSLKNLIPGISIWVVPGILIIPAGDLLRQGSILPILLLTEQG